MSNITGNTCLSRHESTASGRNWMIRKSDPSMITLYKDTYNLSFMNASILTNRDINQMNIVFNSFMELDSVSMFIRPSLEDILKQDIHLPDLDIGCKLLLQAIKEQKLIGLFGDYDVDGMSSCALFVDFLKEYDVEPSVWIPSRNDGYGLSMKGIDAFKEDGVELLFILDCGSQDEEIVSYAKSVGMDVVIIDHHKIANVCAKPDALINPFRVDIDFIAFQEYKQLCAAGLCFMFLAAFRKYDDTVSFEKLMTYTTYAALATVCDVMSLRNILNRALIQTGLEHIMKGEHIGLSAVMEILKMPSTICANHLGFTIGPRLNAGARMNREDLSFKLLTTKSQVEAVELAQKLDNLNSQRRQVEEMLTQDACAQADRQINNKVLFIQGVDWHVGVVGIISSILKDIYHKPVIVVSFKQEGDEIIGKGSARSIDGIDIGQLLQRAVEKGILLSGGGHALAAGLTIDRKQVQHFLAFLEQELFTEKASHISSYNIDAITTLEGLMSSKDINVLSPFGCDFATPKICVTDLYIERIQTYKMHTIVYVSQGRVKTSFFAFKTYNTNLGLMLQRYIGHVVDILFSINDNGQAHIIDIKLPSY